MSDLTKYNWLDDKVYKARQVTEGRLRLRVDPAMLREALPRVSG
jgi:SOS response regulatory protein OraA/RecX